MNQESGIRNQESKPKIRNFFDLDCWQESHNLVLQVYRETKNFPSEKQFGLTNQLRRAAVSITSNIAEGFSRQSYKEKAKFYGMALGSLTEVQNQLMIARDVSYLDVVRYKEVMDKSIRVSKILNGLIKKSRSIHDSGFMIQGSEA